VEEVVEVACAEVVGVGTVAVEVGTVAAGVGAEVVVGVWGSTWAFQLALV
jgi:hypothetical protein